MPQSVTDWILADSGKDKHVDPSLGDYPALGSESVLIGARVQLQDGESLQKSGGDYPTMDDFTAIGIVQTASIQQQKNLQQLFEIGSGQLYAIPGRFSVGATLSRVLVEGQSLMRALYGGLELDLGDAGFKSENSSYIMNLTSKLLDNPFDLLFLFFNKQQEPLGGFYLENCYVHQHQMALNASHTMVIENIGLLASRIVSLNVG